MDREHVHLVLGSRQNTHRQLLSFYFLLFTFRSRPRGSTLLLSLLILGGFVATSFTIGTVVIRQLRDVRAIDQSILASYAAETAIEDLLYRVRKEGQFDNFATVGTMANGTTWERTVQTAVDERVVFLDKDEPVQLDLFPVTGEQLDIGVRSLRINALGAISGGWLEVMWVPWLDSGAWADSFGRTLRGPTELANPDGIVVDLTQHPTGGTSIAYRVRLRALESPLGLVRIRAASDTQGNTLVPFPAGIRATAVGESHGSRFASQVEFPARLPLAPAFDYVLFSTCDIVKGGTATCS